jgi:SSS family solute:Na+ symporter
MLLHYFNPSWVAIGVMGLAASLVSTFANNVSGFSAAFVQGVYQAWIRPHQSDRHYLRMGRLSNVMAIVLSIGAAYSALSFQSLMEYIQMILSTFNAPIFALVAGAAIVPRRAAPAGLWGLLVGLASAGMHQLAVCAGFLHYGSRMSANFYAAILSFTVTAVVTLAAGGRQAGQTSTELLHPRPSRVHFTYSGPTVAWAVIVLVACIVVNVWFR